MNADNVKKLNATLSEPEFVNYPPMKRRAFPLTVIILDGIDYDAIIGVEVSQILGLSIDVRAHKLR